MMAGLLLVLKILGAVLLGLLVLALCFLLLLLFVPFRYDAEAAFHEKPAVRFSVSWLFRLIRLDFSCREGSTALSMSVFGRKLPDSGGKEKKAPEKKTEEEGEQPKRKSPVKRLRILAEDERTGTALKKALRLLLKLLGHLLPKRLSGELLFGAEDPDTTGKILAALAAFLPLHRNVIRVTPDFSGKVLDGQVRARGRMLLCFVLCLGLRFLLDKNVRYVLKTIKQDQIQEVENG